MNKNKDLKKVLLECLILVIVYGIMKLGLNPILEMIPFLKENIFIKDLINGIIMSTILILYLFHYKKTGILKLKGKQLIKGLIIVLPLILIFVINIIVNFNTCIEDGLELIPISKIIINALSIIIGAAFTEEVLFRGIILNKILDFFGRNSIKNVFISIIIVSGLFGLVHLSNVFQGADIGSSLFMATVSVFTGIAFAAIYIRSKSIWPGIIIHSLMDIMGGVESIFFDSGIMMNRGVDFQNISSIIVIIVLNLVFLLYALFILRKKKSNEYLQK